MFICVVVEDWACIVRQNCEGAEFGNSLTILFGKRRAGLSEYVAMDVVISVAAEESGH